jgi:hypothetical protein
VILVVRCLARGLRAAFGDERLDRIP